MTSSNNYIADRDWRLDALKGIGIFLMIIGHVMSPVRNIIFSFHMPLFFFVSGYLYKDRVSKDILVRNSKKVLLPYVVTCFFIWFVFILKDNNWKWGLSILLANGTDTVWNMTGLMVGPLWFLVCYVVSLLGFHYVLKIKGGIIQILVIMIFWGVAFGIKKQWGLQPLGLLNAIPAICCLWMGYSLKDERIKKILFSKWSNEAGLAIWLFCLIYGALSMAGLIYKLWFIQLIGALYATWLIYKILCIEKLSGGAIICFNRTIGHSGIMHSFCGLYVKCIQQYS